MIHRYKLILSDMDGTLLLNGSRKVTEKQIEVIDNAIKKHGILFGPASGRQYANLRRNFEPIKDKLIYVCENGGLIKYKGETLYKESLDRQLGLDIIEDIYNRENCEVLLSGENTSYLLPKSDDYVEHMVNAVGNDVTVIKDFNDVKEDFIKISVYCKDGIEGHDKYFHSRWNGLVNDTVSGRCWQDFTPIGVHKGNAIRFIQNKFGISSYECACFGDNYNDLEMFDMVYHSFAIYTSPDDITKRARFQSAGVDTTFEYWEKYNLFEW